jgi:hypothetical protein
MSETLIAAARQMGTLRPSVVSDEDGEWPLAAGCQRELGPIAELGPMGAVRAAPQ